jgi:Hemerythrin HHE cation binding domain
MTDILVADHAEVDALLRGVLLAFDGGDAREVFSKLDYLWARLAVHIRAEHLHLFPALLSAASAKGAGCVSGTPTPREVLDSVEGLREDHDFFMRELAEAVNGARSQAARGGAADAKGCLRLRGKVQAVAARLSEHNRLEEEQVYLWESALLPDNARAELRDRMKRELDNIPPRFADRAPGR